MLSRSFFISTRVRVWSRKRSFICCSRTLDSPLKLINISLVFSKRSSLFSQSKNYLHWPVCKEQDRRQHHCHVQVNWAKPNSTLIFYWAVWNSRKATSSCKEWSHNDTHMCLWAWMMALTSSELTMLSILLQNTPDAVGSTMMSIKTKKAAKKHLCSEIHLCHVV